MALLAVLCVVVLMVGAGVVIYCIGPLVHARDQRSLIASETASINAAAHDNEGLYRPTLPTLPPAPGTALGILAIPSIGLQQAVVEGVGPSQTVAGPGHVPGTAGLGQPGNSVVVGRRSGYGGPFGRIDQLRAGDRIVVATTEGQSVYVVRSVRAVTIVTTGTPAMTSKVAAASSTRTSTAAKPAPRSAAKSGSNDHVKTGAVAKVNADTLFGPSTHDQLTLVTSNSVVPWNADQATVVVARMHGLPYAPVPQESRSPSQQGNSGDPDALAWLLLDVLALVAILIGSVAFYRRASLRSAYLLTTAPLLVFTILAAEAMSRLLPAWL